MNFKIESTPELIEFTDDDGDWLNIQWVPYRGALEIVAGTYGQKVYLDFRAEQPADVLAALQAWMEQL